MAEIYVPGPFDFVGTANALSQLQSAQQARQSNALQMQYAAEDRARAAQERKAAAGNALAEQARKRELLEIYSNFGVTPAVTGQRGQSYSGTGVANDPYADIQNKLLQKGFASQAGDIAELQNKNLTGQKTTADTKFVTAQTDKEQSTILSNYITLHKEQLNSAPDYDTAIALTIASYTPGHPMAAWLAKNGVSQEQAVTELIRRRDEGIPFEETRALMARGATNAAKDAADLASSKAAAKSSEAAATSSLATAAKTKYEMDNPGFTIESVQTATGPIRVRVDKKTGALTPLTLDGKTVAPEVTPVPPTDLEKLQDLEAKLRAANPNDPRLADVRNAIEKETTNAAGVTVNTGEKASEKTLGEAGSAIIKSAQAIQNYPSSIANLREVKKLIPSAKDMLGGGAETLNNTVNFLNNRLGTNINVKGLTAAAEIRSRLFEGVIARLKQMDSQPSQIQQAALAEALGTIDTDPDALAKVIDVWIDEMQNKVKTHNTQVDKVVKSGNAPAGDWKVDLPEPDAPALVPPTVSNWK